MKRVVSILLPLTLLLAAGALFAQDGSDAIQDLQNLRSQLSDAQNHEAELKTRLEELNFELKPENIERYFNGYGSTRPEELRENRRRKLQIEKDHVVAQLEQLATTKTQLETSISNAQARVYQQSASGALSLRPSEDRGSHLVTAARALVAVMILLLVVGSLVLRTVIRRRRNI